MYSTNYRVLPGQQTTVHLLKTIISLDILPSTSVGSVLSIKGDDCDKHVIYWTDKTLAIVNDFTKFQFLE